LANTYVQQYLSYVRTKLWKYLDSTFSAIYWHLQQIKHDNWS